MIALIRTIPDVVWAAVIASLLTICGVLVTNRGNRRALKEQLLHDAQQRDRERNMELRRDVYLEATEAITTNHMVLMRLTNLEIPDSELGQQFSESAAAISKVSVIGSADTVRAVSELSTELGVRYLQLTAKRLPLIDRKDDIDILNEFIQKSSLEQDRLIELMKEMNLQGNPDERRLAAITRNFEFQQEQSEKYAVERDQLEQENRKELVQFTRDCVQASKDVGKYIVPAVRTVRKEMDLPFEEEEYRATLERSWKTTERSLSDFIDKIASSAD